MFGAGNESPAYEPDVVRKLAEYQLSVKDIPEGAAKLKVRHLLNNLQQAIKN
jgi:hypothetical protein